MSLNELLGLMDWKKIYQKIGCFLQEQDSWMYLAIFLVLSAVNAVNEAPHSWSQYLGGFFTLSLLYLPVLFFVHHKKALKSRLWLRWYLLLWVVVFVLYPAGVVVFAQLWLPAPMSYFGNADYFMGLGPALGITDLLIEANHYWRREERWIRWFKKIGINRAILLTMLLFSLMFSMMTVSDLDSLLQNKVINPNIAPLKVVRHFFYFMAFTIQFFLIYGALYFFYWLNDKVLIPFLLKRRGVLFYAVGSVGCIALFFPLLGQLLVSLPLVRLAPSLMPQGTLEVFNEHNAMLPFIVIICSLPVIVALQWFQQNHEITQLEQQQTEQELHLLKQQINPHFFFNTLNNLYALSLEKSDQSPNVILQLSELMRYVIYKGKEKEVMLAEEINYLRDYIDLQKIRLHKSIDLHFEEQIDDPALKVPPLLLIILLENAFKHGVEPAEHPAMLRLHVKSDGRRVWFTCENSFEPMEKRERGIGLENLRRRMELLFPDRHQLTTHTKGNIFVANLQLWMS